MPADAPEGLSRTVCSKPVCRPAAIPWPGREIRRRLPERVIRASHTGRIGTPISRTWRSWNCVGRGGMGVVYKARQKQLDRLVALKILSPDVGQGPGLRRTVRSRGPAMAMLSHPHIVTVYDFGQTDGLYYFLMEFVDGVNLRQLLDAGKLAPQEALAIVPQICDALQYAHDKGIVHRDIKPENILLDKDGQVKIADFGLAKLVGREAKDFTLTGAGQVMGTPHYMAPEQIEHPQEVDHRADIYSLGVVFYQMLTGELPIGRFAPPSKKVQIDVRLDEVVLRALEKEPERRYQQASEVKTQVERYCYNAPDVPNKTGVSVADSKISRPPSSSGAGGEPSKSLAGAGIVLLLVLRSWDKNRRVHKYAEFSYPISLFMGIFLAGAGAIAGEYIGAAKS